MIVWADIRYFKAKEFDSPDLPGSGAGMDLAFVSKLDTLRERVKLPLQIHSGFRTAAHNAIVGGVDSSSHEHGKAADIRAIASETRFKIISEALRLGFQRIGIGRTFIHLDDDPSKPQRVAWLY